MSRLTVTQPPGEEPVTLDDARAHFRIDAQADESLVRSLLAAARAHVEATCDLAVLKRNLRLHLDYWPEDRVIALEPGPVMSVAGVGTRDAQGVETLLDPADYLSDPAARTVTLLTAPPFLDPPHLTGFVDFTAGFADGAAGAPETLRRAILLLAAHWYERRELLDGEGAGLPYAVDALLAPHKRVRL